MNTRTFLKTIGGTAAAVVMAPVVPCLAKPKFQHCPFLLHLIRHMRAWPNAVCSVKLRLHPSRERSIKIPIPVEDREKYIASLLEFDELLEGDADWRAGSWTHAKA